MRLYGSLRDKIVPRFAILVRTEVGARNTTWMCGVTHIVYRRDIDREQRTNSAVLPYNTCTLPASLNTYNNMSDYCFSDPNSIARGRPGHDGLEWPYR